jgi:hypothetical protein
MTIYMLEHFLRLCQLKKYSFDLKVRLKILNILYLSKLEQPTE